MLSHDTPFLEVLAEHSSNVRAFLMSVDSGLTARRWSRVAARLRQTSRETMRAVILDRARPSMPAHLTVRAVIMRFASWSRAASSCEDGEHEDGPKDASTRLAAALASEPSGEHGQGWMWAKRW